MTSVRPPGPDPTELHSLRSRFISDQAEAAFLSGESLTQFGHVDGPEPVPVTRAELLPSLINPVIRAAVVRFSDPEPPVRCDHVEDGSRIPFWWPDLMPNQAWCGPCYPLLRRASRIRGVTPACNRCRGSLEQCQLLMDNRSQALILMTFFCRRCIENAVSL